jgi:two-component system, OmpR family, KDP operon response regulator KdpE
MTANRVLVVDDDASIRATVVAHLSASGFDVVEASDGLQALQRFRAADPDVVVSDLAMPVADGFHVIEQIRSSGDTPIIVLSVRGGDVDKVRALEMGADDYVVKPFSLVELLARVRAHLRRSAGSIASILNFPELSIDVERRRVVQGIRELKLTPKEFAILEFMARRAGRPVTFDQIIAAVWRTSGGTTNDAVRVHVGALRRKIEPDPAQPMYIVTEPWIGYRFIAEPFV